MKTQGPWLAVVLALMISCDRGAVLYTDATFRAAAPEIIAAWQDSFWDARETTNLPEGATMEALLNALQTAPPPVALVGFTTTFAERAEIRTRLAPTTFWFFTSKLQTDEPGTISIRRSEAWATLAQQGGNRGAVVFPPDASEEEKNHFRTAWTQAQGGSLVEFAPDGARFEAIDELFWLLEDPQRWPPNLPPSVKVFRNPQIPAPTPVLTVTWRIRTSGLGAMLRQWSKEQPNIAHFLPLETVPDRR